MEDPTSSADPGAARERGSGLVTVWAYLFLTALGLTLGLFGSFLVPAAPDIFARNLSYAVPFVIVTNPAAAALARLLVPHRLGAGVPFLGWLAMVLLLGTARPEGDVVVPGDVRGTSFLVAGAIAGALALAPRQPGKRRSRGSGS